MDKKTTFKNMFYRQFLQHVKIKLLKVRTDSCFSRANMSLLIAVLSFCFFQNGYAQLDDVHYLPPMKEGNPKTEKAAKATMISTHLLSQTINNS